MFPISLSGATAKYVMWFNPMFHGSQEETKRVRNAVLQSSKSCYADADVFISAISSSHMQTVLEFITTLSHVQYGGSGFDTSEWSWLADLLITNASSGMQIVVPQMVGLGITRDPVPREAPTIFKVEPVQALFQEKMVLVMNILANADLSKMTAKDHASVAVARTKAVEWLSDNTQNIKKADSDTIPVIADSTSDENQT